MFFTFFKEKKYISTFANFQYNSLFTCYMHIYHLVPYRIQSSRRIYRNVPMNSELKIQTSTNDIHSLRELNNLISVLSYFQFPVFTTSFLVTGSVPASILTDYIHEHQEQQQKKIWSGHLPSALESSLILFHGDTPAWFKTSLTDLPFTWSLHIR